MAMEWTGARYADCPSVEVETHVDAPPERVWVVVSDVELMPSMSGELQRVEWEHGAGEVGSSFVGHSKHPAIGEWSTTSYVIESEAPRVFAWAVGDATRPAASWRFSLERVDGGTRLRQWMQMGPARSGLSSAIDRMPDKEQKIVHGRMREFEASMTATLAAIKERVERVSA
ncbi:MAG: hypothetical protein QOG20_5454 [Pseudonocardiales bacterium]|jgi:uncharacterized protein YndB with AHSA1/START domain|nr:hypothetical protein [Pseudonocardiales bacterium]